LAGTEIRELDEATAIGECRAEFKGAGRFWLNRLKRKCLGPTRDMVVTIDHRGLSVCAADEVHARALLETLR